MAPIQEPMLKTRGYFFYSPEPMSDAPAIDALRNWLLSAGSHTERVFPTYPRRTETYRIQR